jgi:hypothetical protein
MPAFPADAVLLKEDWPGGDTSEIVIEPFETRDMYISWEKFEEYLGKRKQKSSGVIKDEIIHWEKYFPANNFCRCKSLPRMNENTFEIAEGPVNKPMHQGKRKILNTRKEKIERNRRKKILKRKLINKRK